MKRSSLAVSTGLCGKLIWILTGFQAVVVTAEEIDVFRLVDFHGFLQSTTQYDGYKTQSIDVETITREPRTQRELGLSTHSYIYHPNMLNMDFSGSVLMDNSSFTSESTSSFGQTESEGDSLGFAWNFNSRLQFLKEKPYPLTLFYNRSNPLSGGTQTETFNQKNTSYGFFLGLHRPFSPVNIDINASRSTNLGESTLQLVDNTRDRLTVRTKHQFLKDAIVSLDYNLNRENSISGSPNLPIQGRSYIEHRFDLNSRWRFGDQKQYYFNQLARMDMRDDPERTSISFQPTFRWNHSPRLQSSYRYNFSSTDLPGDNDSQAHSGSIGLALTLSERLRGNVEVRAGHAEEISQVFVNNYGISASVNYTRPVLTGLDGTLTLGAGGRYDSLDQESTIDQINVIDESHTLTGTTRVTLAREFVIGSSFVVTNTARTQTFVENLDYRLVVIGTRTLLERLISGNILDGQAVLVNYAIDSGSTYSYSTIGTHANAVLSFARYYNLYLRYNDNTQSLESGIPTIQLNSSRSVELGVRADVPMPWWGMSLGGEAQLGYDEEDISSSDSVSLSTFMALPLPYRSNFRATASWTQANNHDSPEDANATRFSADLGSRPWQRLSLTASAYHEITTGGVFEKRRTHSKLAANWQLRKVRISAEAYYLMETQGDIERDRLSAFLFMRRDLW